MNFIPAEITDGKATLVNGVKLEIAIETLNHVNLGIRPEHLTLDDAGVIKVQVEMLEQFGVNTLIHGILQGSRVPIVASLNGIQSIEIGSILNFPVAQEDLHVFDTETDKGL